MLKVNVLFLVLGLIFGLAFQTLAQPTPTVTATNTNSVTGTVSVTNSVSNTNTVSNTVSGTVTVTGTRTGSITGSGSNSVSNTRSGTISNTLSASATNTVTPPPAPFNVTNLCKNHIINICPSWSVPAGFVYTSFLVTVSNTTTTSTFLSSFTSGRITNLAPNTAYTVTVQGFEASGFGSLISAPVVFTTSPQDPKLNATLDIHNITCVSFKNTTRSVIKCSWLPASPTPPTFLSIKWRCVSPIREPDSNHKRIYQKKGAATITAVILHVNRDVATCTVFIKAHYPRRPATRHVLTVIAGQ